MIVQLEEIIDRVDGVANIFLVYPDQRTVPVICFRFNTNQVMAYHAGGSDARSEVWIQMRGFAIFVDFGMGQSDSEPDLLAELDKVMARKKWIGKW